MASIDLSKVAAIGGFIVSGVGYYLFGKLADKVRDSPYYIKAMDILREDHGAKTMLGSPIKDFRISLMDNEKNACDGEKANFAVPVSGPITSGVYYFWANRIDEDWKITKAELQEKNHTAKRLVIVKEEKE